MGLISRVSSRTYRGKFDLLKMAKSIDWTRLGWCMTQNVKVGSHSTAAFANGKVRYAQFKAVSDQVMGKHSAASSRPKTIDFAAYKAALPAQKAWVESMEKQFNETNVPAPVDKLSAAVEAEDGQFEEMQSSTVAALSAAASEAQTQHDQLVNLPPTNQLSNSDLYKMFPEFNPYTAEEMANHGWDPVEVKTEDEEAAIDALKGLRQEQKKAFYGDQWQN